MIFLVLGVVVGLLVASVSLNLILWYTRRSYTAIWRDRAREAEDKAHAAELRSEQQINAMLDRVSTSSRVELIPGSGQVDLEARKYITDEAHDDEHWNDFRNVPEDES